MLTSSEDGTIIVWKASKWEAQRTLKGHKYVCHTLVIWLLSDIVSQYEAQAS